MYCSKSADAKNLQTTLVWQIFYLQNCLIWIFSENKTQTKYSISKRFKKRGKLSQNLQFFAIVPFKTKFVFEACNRFHDTVYKAFGWKTVPEHSVIPDNL